MTDTSNKLPLFYTSLTPLDLNAHRDLTLAAQSPDYLFAARTDIIPLVAAEVAAVLPDYPIVFLKDPTGGVPNLAAVVGTGLGKNLFIDAQGQWAKNRYIPAWVRRYPFLLAHNDAEPDKSILVFDPQAAVFSAPGDKLRLIDTEGKATVTLDQILDFQRQFVAFGKATEAMVRSLDEAGVLEEGTLTVKAEAPGGEDRKIQGFLIVNEAKLRELKGQALESLHQNGAIGLAYAQIFSMMNLRNLQAANLAG